MDKITAQVTNEKGSMLILVIMILTIVTIIGISATNVSRTEVLISTNELLYQRNFYAAESGIEHLRQMIEMRLLALQGGSGSISNLTFALQGPNNTSVATGLNFDQGSEWINDANFHGSRYLVKVWDNIEAGESPQAAATDIDNMVWARSVSTNAGRGGRCSIETLLIGRIRPGTTRVLTGYSAQEGAGSGKSYVSADANAISSTANRTSF